jgi:hypothetical protein
MPLLLIMLPLDSSMMRWWLPNTRDQCNDAREKSVRNGAVSFLGGLLVCLWMLSNPVYSLTTSTPFSFYDTTSLTLKHHTLKGTSRTHAPQPAVVDHVGPPRNDAFVMLEKRARTESERSVVLMHTK